MLGSNRWLASISRRAGVPRRVERHLGEDANAHAELHVALDHVRVDGGERHVDFEAARLESLLDRGIRRESEVVGDDRIARERFERELPFG